MMALVQSSFHTTWASLFEMELELNSLDWNGNELEHELELEDMKRTPVCTCSFFLVYEELSHLKPLQQPLLTSAIRS